VVAQVSQVAPMETVELPEKARPASVQYLLELCLCGRLLCCPAVISCCAGNLAAR
jgi:hypothetical protein